MKLSSIRIPQRDIELVIAACAVEGVSRSEFLRAAMREKALRVIRESEMKIE